MDDVTHQMKFDLELPEEEPTGAVALSMQEIQLREEAARRAFESGETWEKNTKGEPVEPYNMDLYEHLRSIRIPFRAAILVAWLATPAKYRHPKTKKELADMLGLSSPRQFSVWMAKNPVLQTFVSEAWRNRSLDRLPDSLEAMYTSAANPDYKGKGDRELHFKLAGILSDKIELNSKTGVPDLTKLSFEDKLKLAKVGNVEELLALKERLKKDQDEPLEEAGDESVTDGS